MRESFKNSEGKIIVEEIIKTVQENKDYLTKLDSALGDGDHGINMNKGMTLCYEKIKNKNLTLSESLEILGNTLLNEIGGAMGPLYGTFFLGMASGSRDKMVINKNDFSQMLHSSLNGILELTTAKLGDKTLLDVLIPAIESFDKCLSEGKDFEEALRELDRVVDQSLESTKGMIAKFGRGARLGELSKGVEDAGAASCALILKAIADSIISIIISK